MATIRKRGEKYQVQVRRQGQLAASRSFLRLKDAQEWARQIETLADRQCLGPDRRMLRGMKLADLVRRYRDEVVPTKKGAAVETVVLNAFLRHRISEKPLATLTTADFASYRDERLSEVSPTTVRRQLNPIRHMFEVARREWVLPIRENPLDGLKLNAPDRRRERRLREGEWDQLIEFAEACRNPLIVKIIRLAVETGMRRGELLAIQREHINFSGGTLLISDSKNGHARTIPLTSEALVILKQCCGETRRVFSISPNAFRLAWERITARAKIEDLHFHDLRHEAISRLFEFGLTIPEVASISGHRDTRMLFRYAHADVKNLATKLNRQEAY